MKSQLAKKLKKSSYLPAKDKLALMLRQSLGKNAFDPFSLSSSPYALPSNSFGIYKFGDALKEGYSRQVHSKGRKLRTNISSQKSNRSSAINQFNTTFNKRNNYFQVQYRPNSDLVNYSQLVRHHVNFLDKVGPPAWQTQTQNFARSSKHGAPKETSLPSLPNSSSKECRKRSVDGLVSFSGSRAQLRAGCGEKTEELMNLERVKPYTLLMNELKPMFFFNVKGKTEESVSTPTFVRSFREEPLNEEEKGEPTIKIHNTGKGNIYINKTTIINNIINSKKRATPKKANKFKVTAFSKVPGQMYQAHSKSPA